MNDIRQILNIPRCILFRAPFNRKNLFYEVLHKSDVGKNAFNTLVHCIQSRFDKQSGIQKTLLIELVFYLKKTKVLFIVYHKKMLKMCALNYNETVRIHLGSDRKEILDQFL
jgi:superfamily II DNA helicase RecQ